MLITNRIQLNDENEELLENASSERQTAGMMKYLRGKQRQLQDTCADSQQERQVFSKRSHKDVMERVTSMAKFIYDNSDERELKERRETGSMSR